MSLSQKLKAAEYERRLAAGLPVDHLDRPGASPAKNVHVDVRGPGAPVIDLTDARWADVIELGGPSAPATTSPSSATDQSRADAADVVEPVVAIGPQVGQRSRIECPHCGGPTQVDLVDAVGHTVSLSCLSCYHMFRVGA